MFYEAASGIRGYAEIETVSDATALDQESLLQFGLYHLAVKLSLTGMVVFPKPIELGPLVERLDFVSNKRFWGHSLRATPRTISKKDFDTILAAQPAT